MGIERGSRWSAQKDFFWLGISLGLWGGVWSWDLSVEEGNWRSLFMPSEYTYNILFSGRIDIH